MVCRKRIHLNLRFVKNKCTADVNRGLKVRQNPSGTDALWQEFDMIRHFPSIYDGEMEEERGTNKSEFECIQKRLHLNFKKASFKCIFMKYETFRLTLT